MQREYAYAMKKAVVNYVLTSRIERERLSLTVLEPLLGLTTPLQARAPACIPLVRARPMPLQPM